MSALDADFGPFQILASREIKITHTQEASFISVISDYNLRTFW